MEASPVSAKNLKELREKTGLGMMECKAALTESKGDIPKAIDHLKRRGLAIAEKKLDKTTSAGCIGSYIHTNGKIGVLVELSCESDFVAQNAEFQELLKDLCLQVAAMNPSVVSRNELSQEMQDKEKEFYRQQIKDETGAGKEKPAEVVERILQGKLDKFYFAQKCLLDQPLIKDESMTVANFIKSKIGKFGENITVKRFARFKLGESA